MHDLIHLPSGLIINLAQVTSITIAPNKNVLIYYPGDADNHDTIHGSDVKHFMRIVQSELESKMIRRRDLMMAYHNLYDEVTELLALAVPPDLELAGVLGRIKNSLDDVKTMLAQV